MSYYDDASLVVIPSGYKTSKVYAEKPTDGSGDLAFTRTGDTATRVNSAGLIEKVRTNVALYSEDLTNAAWPKNRSTITANALANPVNGANTADYIVEDTATGTHEVIQIFTVSSGVSYTVSAYAKADTRTKVALVLAGTAFASGGNGQAIFNLATGAVISAINGATAQISDAGNGWYRCSITKASIDTVAVIALELADASNNTSYTGDGTSRAAFFGAQLEVSDFGATPYIVTTTAAVSTGPVANVPRLDYLGSTCPRLLLEPQRTNLFTNSETFNSANWVKSGATITANVAVSPDGYTNADLQTGGEIYQQKTQPNATACTMSLFVKKDTATNVTIRYIDNVSGFVGGGITYTYATGAISVNQSANASVSGEAISYGNGWFRLILKYTSTASVTFNYQGIFGSGSFIYGAQFETSASYATSYIPTLAASATRGADACSKTGISSLIGQTQGTLFADFTIPTMANTGANLVSISLFNSGITNVTLFDIYDSGNLFAVHVNGTAQASIQKTSFTAGRHKVAFGYKANDFVLYVDGVLVGTDTSGTVGAQDSFGLQYGTSQFIGQQYVNQALVFPTRLTNAELAELTTL